jgi:oxygen-independent coproporphyrinogen-3 oxidase
MMDQAGYEHYEFSNFGRAGYFSRNNLAYWTGKAYLGIGPSAHSYDGNRKRGWNVANNMQYMKSIEAGQLSMESETLSLTDKYNELVMTRLRTIYGLNLVEIEQDYGQTFALYLQEQARPYLADELLEWRGNHLHVTKKGKFLSDGIASGLFKVNLGNEGMK